MTAVLKVIAFRYTYGATFLIEREGALLRIIKVTRVAFLPSSNVTFPNTGGYRWLQYMELILPSYSDVSFLQTTKF